jgi:hypothetical protein
MLNQFSVKQEFNTPLGIIKSGFYVDSKEYRLVAEKQYPNAKALHYHTRSYSIEIVIVDLPIEIGEEIIVHINPGVLFYIEKLNDSIEQLHTFCLLEDNPSGITMNPANGEHLDGIQICNDTWVMHMGTEDGEMLHLRAKHNNWMPERLQPTLSVNASPTQVKPNGFVTAIPELQTGEKIYFQYLNAYEKGDANCLNTWLIIDWERKKLESFIHQL